MAIKGLSDRVADLAMERVADGVVEALMKAGFGKQFADAGAGGGYASSRQP